MVLARDPWGEHTRSYAKKLVTDNVRMSWDILPNVCMNPWAPRTFVMLAKGPARELLDLLSLLVQAWVGSQGSCPNAPLEF